ncbi:MAG: haloacid dehalogenase-like hydrolase [Bacilli bacterium]|nr:haloacid dehalogenase-like hydrolase [Bacilli bacterium]
MNVYDFDKTICRDDTEEDFFRYALWHYPSNLLHLFYFAKANILYHHKKISEAEWRHRLYLVLKPIKDIDQTVLKFWKKRKKKILPWYKKQQKPDDVIISATPRFLLEPMLIALNIKHYILSEFDVKARQFIGPINVEGEKLRRFKKFYPNATIDNFYTDSLRDTPLLLAAKNAFLVNKKYQVIPWNNKN